MCIGHITMHLTAVKNIMFGIASARGMSSALAATAESDGSSAVDAATAIGSVCRAVHRELGTGSICEAMDGLCQQGRNVVPAAHASLTALAQPLPSLSLCAASAAITGHCMNVFGCRDGDVTSGAAAPSISSSVADSAGQLPHTRCAVAQCPLIGALASCCQLAAASRGASLPAAACSALLLTAQVTPAVTSAAKPASPTRPVAACSHRATDVVWPRKTTHTVHQDRG